MRRGPPSHWQMGVGAQGAGRVCGGAGSVWPRRCPQACRHRHRAVCPPSPLPPFPAPPPLERSPRYKHHAMAIFGWLHIMVLAINIWRFAARMLLSACALRVRLSSPPPTPSRYWGAAFTWGRRLMMFIVTMIIFMPRRYRHACRYAGGLRYVRDFSPPPRHAIRYILGRSRLHARFSAASRSISVAC